MSRTYEDALRERDALRDRIHDIENTPFDPGMKADDARRTRAAINGLASQMRADLSVLDREVEYLGQMPAWDRAIDTRAADNRGTEYGIVGDSYEARAFRTIDAARDCPDEVRQLMTVAVESAKGEDRDRLARHIAATATRSYESAFAKLITDPMNGHRLFTDEELRAYQTVQREARALSLVDANGGFLVPATVDYSVMLTTAGSVNPLRGIARRVQTSTESWSRITSAGITASFDAEASEVSDDSPSFAQPTIPVHRASAYVQASIEVAADSGVAQQLTPLFADAKDQLEATAYTLGSGVGQPTGVVTKVAATPGSVVSDAGGSLTAAMVTNLQNVLPARWRPRARWMANLTTLNVYRTIVGGTGLTVPMLVGNEMLGWPTHENSIMDGSIGAGNDYLLLAGDFQQFVIVDRIGMTVQYIPAVFGANRRPTGEVGWFCVWRTGSDVVIPDAFRLLNLSA